MIAKANAGVAVSPEEPETLASSILKLASDPEMRKVWGRNGRKFGEQFYDRQVIAERFVDFIS